MSTLDGTLSGLLFIFRRFFCTIPTHLSVPVAEQHPPAWCCPHCVLTVGRVLMRWCSVSGFPPHASMGIAARYFSLRSIRPEYLCFSRFKSPSGVFQRTPSRPPLCPFREQPLYHDGLTGGVLHCWLSFCKVHPSPQKSYGSHLQWQTHS